MVVLLEGSSRVTVIGHLPDQGPSPIAQFGRAASSRKSLGVPFKNDGGHCVLGDLQYCRKLLVPFPRCWQPN
jgi:hypothetical protein